MLMLCVYHCFLYSLTCCVTRLQHSSDRPPACPLQKGRNIVTLGTAMPAPIDVVLNEADKGYVEIFYCITFVRI
jgi:hypothetical protein